MSFLPKLKRKTKMTLVVGGCVTCFAGSVATESDAGMVMASHYGEELRGSPTASGELFNPDGLTAAHKTLPLGTQLEVCHDSCTTVRVNDRGPHVAGRDIDLSTAAADSIGVEGVEPVAVSEVDEEPVVEEPEPAIEVEAPKPITELPHTGGAL